MLIKIKHDLAGLTEKDRNIDMWIAITVYYGPSVDMRISGGSLPEESARIYCDS